MNQKLFKLSAIACGSLLMTSGVQAETWVLNVESGTTSEAKTIPAGTDAINKTGAGTYELRNSGTSAFHGDATVAGTFRIMGNTLDMGAGTITKKGSGWFQLWGLTVQNPGDIICQAGTVTLAASCDLGAPNGHQIALQGGTLQMSSVTKAVSWPVSCSAAATFSESGGSASKDSNKITGPVTASDNMTVSAAGRLTFANDFSMSSGRKFYKTGDGVVRFCGKTTMNGVTAWLQKGLLLYGDGADVTGYLPSSEYTTDVRRPAIKVENGAKVVFNDKGDGYGTLGFQNYAAFWMTGGQVDITLPWGWQIGQTGGADLLVSGGALDIKSGLLAIGKDTDNGMKKNPYTVSVSGEASVLKVNSTISSGADGAVLNVGGGATLSSKKISRSTSYPDFTVNFDNGVFKPRYEGHSFGRDSESPRLLVQDGGLVYDTTDVVNGVGEGSYSQLYSSLEKPTGKVIAEIGLPTELSDPANYEAFAEASYSIPTSVRISGAGFGASAFLEIDELTLKPVRIVVTGAGSGYDDETTTVTIDSPDGASRYVCPVTLKTPAGTGSLVKRGSNSLILYGANTYGGATILEAGWTKFSGDAAYPDGSPLTIRAGAHFETENRTIPYRVKSLAGTGIFEKCDMGLVVSEKLIVDLADLRAGRSMTCNAALTIEKDVVVEVVDSEGLWTPVSGNFIKVNNSYTISCASSLKTVAEQERWKVVIKDNCLRLKPERGLAIIFR